MDILNDRICDFTVLEPYAVSGRVTMDDTGTGVTGVTIWFVDNYFDYTPVITGSDGCFHSGRSLTNTRAIF